MASLIILPLSKHVAIDYFIENFSLILQVTTKFFLNRFNNIKTEAELSFPTENFKK